MLNAIGINVGIITVMIFVCDVQVPLIIHGDPAYPSLPWLLKPYPDNSYTTPTKKLFNYRQRKARMVVENAFDRLKMR